MYPDASFASPLPTDAEFGTFRGQTSVAVRAPRAPVLGWRHLATLVLLMLALPVFAAAAVAALPVMLVVGSGEGLRRWLPALRR